MGDSRRFPHYASALHVSNDQLPDYHWSATTMPSTVLAQGGANTQAIFQFDDIPSDSPESTPSSASSQQRGRSRWSTQTRFTHDYHDTAHRLTVENPSPPLDPRYTTSYSQIILFPEQPQPQSSLTYEHHGSSVPSQPIRSSNQSSSAQQLPQHTRAHGSYERSLAPHLDWREVEMSAAIRMQDMGQPTMLEDAKNTSFASRGMLTAGYSDHKRHPVIGRCEQCGYKDHWPIVEEHRRNCVGSQHK